MTTIFVALLINGTKIASGESVLRGNKFCQIVLSSVVFCKAKPVGDISFAPSIEDGGKQSQLCGPESIEYGL